MIRLSRWQTFFIGFGIIVAMLIGERLLFLNKAEELTVVGGFITGRTGSSKQLHFTYKNQDYTFTSFGFSSLSNSEGKLLIDPDNPSKAYINTFPEIWIPRMVGHLLALIVWYMIVSSFITKSEFVRFSFKGISREPKTSVPQEAVLNQKQISEKNNPFRSE